MPDESIIIHDPNNLRKRYVCLTHERFMDDPADCAKRGGIMIPCRIFEKNNPFDVPLRAALQEIVDRRTISNGAYHEKYPHRYEEFKRRKPVEVEGPTFDPDMMIAKDALRNDEILHLKYSGKCPNCKGSGWVLMASFQNTYNTRCPICAGSGRHGNIEGGSL